MSDPANRDPAEGSRKIIDRELARAEGQSEEEGRRGQPSSHSRKTDDMPMTPEDDEIEPDEDAFDQGPQGTTISDMVRESPIGALVGAFVAGFLIARLL
jgi:hypothetical protein